MKKYNYTLIGLFLFITSVAANATDIVGSSGNLATSGNILSSSGLTVGTNLFHQFQRFSISQGDTITFTDDTASSFSNVITRIMGGQTSYIYGNLVSTIDGADFYLINPAGVTFGEYASVNVPASFHVSTANQLIFTDGTELANNESDPSKLTSAPPTAFGFYGATAGNITWQATSSTLFDGDLSLSAANIEIQDGDFQASESNIHLTAVGNVAISIPINSDSTDQNVNGQIILNGTRLLSDAYGATDAGMITINSGNLSSTDSEISSEAYGSANAGNVTIKAAGNLRLESSDVSSSVEGSGDAGTVKLLAGGTLMIIGSEIASDADDTSTGNAGSLTISGNKIYILDGGGEHSEITSNAQGDGNAGSILIQGDQLVLNNSLITVAAEGESAGDAGAITLQFSDSVQISNGSAVTSSAYGLGDAGSINVSAPTILIDGVNSQLLSAAYGSAGIDAGNVSLEGNTLFLTDNASLLTTSSSGAGGGISLNFRDIIVIKSSSIQTSVFGGAGGGGDINIDPIAIIFSDATIQANAIEGNGGNINIVADYLIFDAQNPSVIEATSETGVDGVIATDALDGNALANIEQLSLYFADVTKILNSVCASQRKGISNSLVLLKQQQRYANIELPQPVSYTSNTELQDEQSGANAVIECSNF